MKSVVAQVRGRVEEFRMISAAHRSTLHTVTTSLCNTTSPCRSTRICILAVIAESVDIEVLSKPLSSSRSRVNGYIVNSRHAKFRWGVRGELNGGIFG